MASGSPAGPHDPSCIFCRIVRKEAPGHVLYESEHALAFLDIAPLSRGHALVVPKAPVDRLTEVSPAHYQDLLRAVVEMCRRTERLSRDYNVGVNQGALAGQVVFHLHFHIIPRYPGAGAVFPRSRAPLDASTVPELLDLLGRP